MCMIYDARVDYCRIRFSLFSRNNGSLSNGHSHTKKRGKKSPPPDEDDTIEGPEADGQWEVERLVDYFKDLDGDMYEVKWKGWEEGESKGQWSLQSDINH